MLKKQFDIDLAIKTAEQQNMKLLSAKQAREYREKARRKNKIFKIKTRWESWKWLIRKHRRVHRQLLMLKQCSAHVDLVEKNIGAIPADDLTVFIRRYKSIKNKRSPINSLDDLREGIKARRDDWIKTKEAINKVSPPVLFTHAFLKLSDSTGIEVVSIFIGGLLGLGAIYMATFFKVAVNLSSMDYWTLEDLAVHGIRVLPFIAFALVTAELFFLLGRRRFGYRPHQWILNRPLRVVGIFFIWSVVVVAMVGYVNGKRDFRGFVNGPTQMATVMDGTVLEQVYLVGTTDRTAIFLQPDPIHDCKIAYCAWKEKVKKEKTSNYRYTWHDFSKDAYRPWRVLVMDRALVVCHGQKGDCKPGNRYLDRG